MILDIYNDSIKYSIKNSKSIFYLGLTLFSTFIIWMVYLLMFINYQDVNLNIRLGSSIIPFILLFIPLFLFLGYEYKILKISTHGMINGTDKVPEFNNLKEMLINGAKIFCVKFIYFIIPTAILAITNINYLNHISGGVIGTIGAIIALILGIILYFISSLSTANMANYDNFKKAFDMKEIKEIIQNIGIIRYILFYIGLLIIEFLIVFILSTIVMIAMMLIGTTISSIAAQPFWWAVFIITNFIFCVIIAIAEIFRTRGIGLIYEPIEE
ncbi:DUF4013 domain-containing protein [uncultured Methanobrevibacter sp.]|uniref:DUF4013 domain-containing protein n=1 Tax=uncultured Methanobrevibacter sp. TaxID=253161 RepID=UPI002635F392|nr:DUF4013 domain-containing protein [uncultured Methanobrevibacter sp.]